MRNPAKFVKYADQQQPHPFLPDDIFILIIRRLDVRDVARCRCVCKTWKDMTSDPQFEDSLLMPVSNLPMILAQTITREICIDKWWQTEIPTHEVASSSSVYRDRHRSQNGFILSRINHILTYENIVRNPMTGEQVTIFMHKESLPTYSHANILGIYRRDQHYCTLWRVLMGYNFQTQYKMLDLGSDQPTCWRNIGHLWNHTWALDTSVICLDGFMYWMVNCNVDPFVPVIIAFDMKTEEFTEISLPSTYIHSQLIHPPNILNADGSLSLVQVVVDKVITVHMWTLKDHKTRFWTTSQYVLFLVKRHPKLWKRQPRHRGTLYQSPKALAVVNSKLVMEGKVEDDESYPSTRGLFVCNLKYGTMKRLRNSESWAFCVHHPTIASLRNCPPVLHITQE